MRDKLRGIESTDIDISVDNMSGVEFSALVRQYVAEHTALTISSVGVIKPNPAIGKHLETATLHINHIAIDICGLRSSAAETVSPARLTARRPAPPRTTPASATSR